MTVDFEVGAKPRPWKQLDAPSTLRPADLYFSTDNQLEIVYAAADSKPKADEAKKLWKARWNSRPAAVLLVVGYPSSDGPRARVVGLREDTLGPDMRLADVAADVRHALSMASGSQGERALRDLFVERADDEVPGLRNTGLFATHELLENVPTRADWASARTAGEQAAGTQGEELISALGWKLAREGSELILGGPDRDHAVAIVLEGGELFDRPSARFGTESPVERAISIARSKRLTWVVAVQGPVVRLYTADPDVGIARQSVATFTELDVSRLADEHLAYLGLLFTPAALAPQGSVEQILEGSADHALSLAERLRDRVYKDVVPDLAKKFARHLNSKTAFELDEAYHLTLIVLFRLLFVAYGEDRAFLPYGSSPQYTRISLKARARQYARKLNEFDEVGFDPQATDIWDDLGNIWDGIHDGHLEWGLPAYGGSLFSAESSFGQFLADTRLTNLEIGPPLVSLLVDRGRDGSEGPVDFRALSVREFGTIYEGLLESSLGLAPSDLTLDADEVYVPAKPGSKPVVEAGEVYFHNASGARKATGSYFTKQFVVEHLVAKALDTTLSQHLERVAELLDDGRDADAADLLLRLSSRRPRDGFRSLPRRGGRPHRGVHGRLPFHAPDPESRGRAGKAQNDCAGKPCEGRNRASRDRAVAPSQTTGGPSVRLRP